MFVRSIVRAQTMTERLWVKFPIFLAVFFCLYAYGMIVNSLDTYHLLRDKEQARVIAENAQKAATLGDYLAQEQSFVRQIADGPEVNNFLANQALGMSLQYGLQASLDAIAAAFDTTLQKRRIGGEPLFSRLAYVDAAGNVVVDSDNAAVAPFVNGEGVTVDAVNATVQLVAPVSFRGTPAGSVVVWSDLDRLARFLLPAPEHSQAVFVVTTQNGDEVHLSAAGPSQHPLHDQIVQAGKDKLQGIWDANRSLDLVIIKHAIPGIPLDLTTVAPKESLLGPQHSLAFLLIAGIFPPIVLVSTIVFERMRQQNAKTELKLHATRLRLQGIADHLIEGNILMGRDGRILFINRPGLRLLGQRDVPQKFVGQPIWQLLRLPDGIDPTTAWHTVMDQAATLIVDDGIFITADDRQIAVAYSCTPLEDSQHGPSVILSFRDISGLKQAQHEAMQSMRLASIGQLAAGIAHEINTPAQYIGDNLAYVQDGLAELTQTLAAAESLDAIPQDRLAEWRDELPLAVKDCQDGIAQIARIVLSMKEFSHPGTIGSAAADINRALDNTLTVSRNAWKHVAEVERQFDPDLPMVTCHLGELNQVFINLIMNAVQAIEGKPNTDGTLGKITIQTRLDGQQVVISVADTGSGIADVIKDRIFDPFFTTKDVGKGSGQGLAICRDVVVNRHHGTITATNQPAGGAIFTIRLPLESSSYTNQR